MTNALVSHDKYTTSAARYSPHPVGPTIIVSLLALIFSITRRFREEGKAFSFVIAFFN
jgi:hypothetical protein